MVFAEAYPSPVPSPATTMPGKQIYDSEEEKKSAKPDRLRFFCSGLRPSCHRLKSGRGWPGPELRSQPRARSCQICPNLIERSCTARGCVTSIFSGEQDFGHRSKAIYFIHKEGGSQQACYHQSCGLKKNHRANNLMIQLGPSLAVKWSMGCGQQGKKTLFF